MKIKNDTNYLTNHTDCEEYCIHYSAGMFLYYKNKIIYRDNGPSVVGKYSHVFIHSTSYIRYLTVEEYFNLSYTKDEFKFYYLNNLDEFKENYLGGVYDYSSKKYIDEYNELLNLVTNENK